MAQTYIVLHINLAVLLLKCTKINNTESVMINNCVDGVLQKNNNLFPNKLPQKWNNITIKVATFYYPPYVVCVHCEDFKGLEIQILELLADNMKFDIEYINITYKNWGAHFINGTFNGALGDIQTHKADLGLGMFHPGGMLEHIYFDMSFPYMEDELKWIVPAAKTLNQWDDILEIFTVGIWMLLIMCLLLVAFVLCFLQKDVSSEGIIYFLITTFQSLFGSAYYFRPKKNSVRFVFILWSSLGYIICVAFQSKLITILSTTVYERQVHTLRDMLQSSIKFGYLPLLNDIFKNSPDIDEQYISKNYTECEVDLNCINRTAFERDFATVKSKKLVEYLIPLYYLESDGSSMVYIFKSSIMTIPVNMFFAKGYPLFKQINNLLINIKSSGFIEFYYKNIEDINRHHCKHSKTILKSKSLTFRHVDSIFILLFVGFLLSILVFILEISIKYIVMIYKTDGTWIFYSN